MLLIHVGEQALHQLADIFLVFAQGGHMNVKDVQAVIKILAKFTSGYGFVRDFVGGGKHANIDRSLYLAPEAAQLVVFEDAQEFGLGADRHFANFVEKQRAPFGEFETPGSTLERARECALFVTEDFAFN